MPFENVLFDMDGTIVDSYEGITKCVSFALSEFDIKTDDRNALRVFIGPPLYEEFIEYAGFSHEQAQLAVKKYREHYNSGLYKDCKIYDGIEKLLIRLKEHGKKVFLATSKPEIMAKQILEYLKIEQHFDFIGGSEYDGGRHDKIDVLNYVIEENHLDISRSVMVGDRYHDIEGAKAFGMKSIGVLYGFGGREELEASGADYIVENADQILKIVL